MEGRGLSDFYRNTSEELILRSYMESSNGTPLPTMEMLGFKNLSQNFRADSEELFKSWLTTGENNTYNSSSIAHRTRSRRISTEIASLSAHQHVGLLQKKRSNEVLFPQYNPMPDENSADLNQHSNRLGVERGMQASDLYLAKAWFHSSQPMTRSRSSELRKRYVALQNSQPAIGLDGLQNASGNYNNVVKEEFAFSNGFNVPSICEVSNQLGTFISPSNSSSSTFDAPQMGDMDKVSSVVSMLKGTLERKKLSNQIEKGAEDDSSTRLFPGQEVIVNTGFDQGQGNQLQDMVRTFQEVSTIEVKDHAGMQKAEGSLDLEMEGFVNLTNPNPLSRNSQEPSQSESSAAAPVVSSGFDACDGPSNSSQTLSICESSLKRAGNRSSENGSRSKDIRERIIGNLKDDQKRGERLERYGSVTSATSGDKEDATKKRRVERSRKMAEAKERNSTPVIPSDIQSVLKRCENLEKEVRSLKLNLSFMNRKDSEQTKQIEELQQQNEELTDEKERLLEEIERILAENGKI
ncbi:protein CYCLOPS-like isoform X1 [Rosa rugosa]|uniref:protein CYCLOPS-like isoform X1 n=1 Tax=Rosa rugosa TaxID=74645 RepID=UPI002B410B89|nr:protein CYCLOPS-like isoform X1 [Rosa rugosa]XP_061988519.1 protein CYCLOPS-like isoform X1 [Rosa rugosa]